MDMRRLINETLAFPWINQYIENKFLYNKGNPCYVHNVL